GREEGEDERIGVLLFPCCRDGLQLKEASQGSIGCRQQAPLQELSASRLAAGGVGPEHARSRGSELAGRERQAWEACAGARGRGNHSRYSYTFHLNRSRPKTSA